MTKELGALKELKYVHDTECGEDKSVNERFALIETALKRLKDLEKWFFEDKDYKNHKALEIIKENLIVSYDESNNDKPCLMLGVKVDKDKLVIIYETFDKDKIDLLKEVLL